jgi:hypothetical protein
VGDVDITDGAASTAPAVSNEKLKSAAISFGGSLLSASVICVAVTPTVQCALNGRLEDGVRVNDVAGDAL